MQFTLLAQLEFKELKRDLHNAVELYNEGNNLLLPEHLQSLTIKFSGPIECRHYEFMGYSMNLDAFVKPLFFSGVMYIYKIYQNGNDFSRKNDPVVIYEFFFFSSVAFL